MLDILSYFSSFFDCINIVRWISHWCIMVRHQSLMLLHHYECHWYFCMDSLPDDLWSVHTVGGFGLLLVNPSGESKWQNGLGLGKVRVRFPEIVIGISWMHVKAKPMGTVLDIVYDFCVFSFLMVIILLSDWFNFFILNRRSLLI